MLKTNSLIFRKKIRNYLLEAVKDYNENQLKDENSALKEVYFQFTNEYMHRYNKAQMARFQVTEYELFREWAKGLPCGATFDYCLGINAVELLGGMLEQTPNEKQKFSNDEAAERLTYFIYREVKKNRKEW